MSHTKKNSYVIVGATGHIGESVTKSLASRSEQLILLARDTRKLENIEQSIARMCAVHTLVVPENLNHSDVDRQIQKAFCVAGPLNGMVFCIGTNEPKPFEQMECSEWNVIIRVNLNAAFYFIHSFLQQSKILNYDNRPRIVLISSSAGLEGFPNSVAYCAAKHGQLGLVRAIASEYKSTDVKICAICPGLLNSPSFFRNIEKQAHYTGEKMSSIVNKLTNIKPLQEWPTIAQVASLVISLLYNERQFENGEIILI